MSRRAWLGALLLAGCVPASVVVNGHAMAADDWSDAQRAVLSVATFEMKCPPPQLQLAVLNTSSVSWGFGRSLDLATQVGVTGCAQSRVYTRFHDKWISGTPPASP